MRSSISYLHPKELTNLNFAVYHLLKAVTFLIDLAVPRDQIPSIRFEFIRSPSGWIAVAYYFNLGCKEEDVPNPLCWSHWDPSTYEGFRYDAVWEDMEVKFEPPKGLSKTDVLDLLVSEVAKCALTMSAGRLELDQYGDDDGRYYMTLNLKR